MIHFGPTLPGGLATHRTDHGIEIPPGDAVGIGPVQRTAAPAALSAVPKALDALLELAQVQRLDLPRTAPADRRPAPRLIRRRQRCSVAGQSPISRCQGTDGKARIAFWLRRSWRAPDRCAHFFSARLIPGVNFKSVSTSFSAILCCKMAHSRWACSNCRSRACFSESTGWRAGHSPDPQGSRAAPRAPAPPTGSRSCGRPPSARPPAGRHQPAAHLHDHLGPKPCLLLGDRSLFHHRHPGLRAHRRLALLDRPQALLELARSGRQASSRSAAKAAG